MTYVILFRYGRPKADGTGQSLQYSCTSDANEAVASNAIELDGKGLKAVYRIQLNATRAAVETESPEIGGESVDHDAGRVFSVELTNDQPAYHQKKLALQAITEKLESRPAIERLANSI